MKDYYKHYQSEGGNKEVSSKQFGSIIKEFNGHVRDRLSFKGDGKVINNLPVNWRETRKLWEENQAAKIKGTKIRYTNEHTDGHTFRIFYIRSKANYKNKSMYKMQFNREMKRQLSTSIFAGRIDAFLN